MTYLFPKELLKNIQHGLEDIPAVPTVKSKVDGSGNGSLYYVGYNIEDLAKHCTYEEVCFLLLYDRLPTKRELQRFNRQLVENREVSKHTIDLMEDCCLHDKPLASLRTMVSTLSAEDPDADSVKEKSVLKKAIGLIAKMPTMVVHVERIRQGMDVVRPNDSLGHAANFLYMLKGKKPDDYTTNMFDKILILQADHGLNASTFTARVTASTLSDFYSSITAAIGALKGPLHGGANEQVIHMLKKFEYQIKDYKEIPEKVRAYIKNKLEKKERVMGMGHRIYKNGDPRARILKHYVKGVCMNNFCEKMFLIAHEMEEVMWKLKRLKPNVDFYSAVLMDSIGIPTELFSSVFAISRSAGWSAHVIEQYANNRLIRPNEVYMEKIVGIDRNFVPIGKR